MLLSLQATIFGSTKFYGVVQCKCTVSGVNLWELTTNVANYSSETTLKLVSNQNVENFEQNQLFAPLRPTRVEAKQSAGRVETFENNLFDSDIIRQNN
jgi:hypothetical protein